MYFIFERSNTVVTNNAIIHKNIVCSMSKSVKLTSMTKDWERVCLRTVYRVHRVRQVMPVALKLMHKMLLYHWQRVVYGGGSYFSSVRYHSPMPKKKSMEIFAETTTKTL